MKVKSVCQSCVPFTGSRGSLISRILPFAEGLVVPTVMMISSTYAVLMGPSTHMLDNSGPHTYRYFCSQITYYLGTWTHRDNPKP